MEPYQHPFFYERCVQGLKEIGPCLSPKKSSGSSSTLRCPGPASCLKSNHARVLHPQSFSEEMVCSLLPYPLLSRLLMSTRSIPCRPPLPDTVVFNSLARRQALIEWFLRDLCADLGKRYVFKPPPGATYHNLGPSEIIRIHRAFYHFDLFALLFAENIYPNVDYDDSFDMEEIQEIYINCMPPWEIQELTCIHAYLHERFREYIYPLPDCKSLNQKPPSKKTDGQQWLQGIFASYSTREHLLSFGLGFLHSLFTASEEKMLKIAGTHAGLGSCRFLGSVLKDACSALTLAQETPDFSERMALKSHEGPSDGWLWVHGEKDLSRKCELDLIGWGYCLWDRRRMEKLVQLDQPFNETKYAMESPRHLERRRARQITESVVDHKESKCPTMMERGIV